MGKSDTKNTDTDHGPERTGAWFDNQLVERPRRTERVSDPAAPRRFKRLVDEAADTEEQAIMNVLIEQLPDYLNLLPFPQRRAVELSFGISDQVERSLCEVAEELGLSFTAARRERDAGIRALRAAFGVEPSGRHLVSVADDAESEGDPDTPVAAGGRRAA